MKKIRYIYICVCISTLTPMGRLRRASNHHLCLRKLEHNQIHWNLLFLSNHLNRSNGYSLVKLLLNSKAFILFIDLFSYLDWIWTCSPRPLRGPCNFCRRLNQSSLGMELRPCLLSRTLHLNFLSRSSLQPNNSFGMIEQVAIQQLVPYKY